MIFEVLRSEGEDVILKAVKISEQEKDIYLGRLECVRADILVDGNFSKIFEENKDMTDNEIIKKFFIGKKIKIDSFQPYIQIAHNARFLDDEEI